MAEFSGHQKTIDLYLVQCTIQNTDLNLKNIVRCLERYQYLADFYRSLQRPGSGLQ